MHKELVRELTLAVHTDEKAIKMVSLLGKAAAQIHSFPIFSGILLKNQQLPELGLWKT